MKALNFVWGFVAFTILGLDFLSKTDRFDALQDFESNIKIVDYPEDFLPNWSANAVRSNSSRVFQAIGEGVEGSQALGIQAINNFNTEIYIKTTTKGLNSNRFSLKAKTKRNGSGNRPISVFYSFAIDGQEFSLRQQIGHDQTFQNEDSSYEEYEFVFPGSFLEKELIIIKLEVIYGEGSGSAARLFIDDFTIHGLREEPVVEALEILSVQAEQPNRLVIQFNQLVALDSEDNPILNHGYGSAKTAVTQEQRLFLEFDDYLYSNKYQLLFSSLASVATGEIWTDSTHSFEIISPTPTGTVLVNEFMADPNPKGLVPEDPVLPQGTAQEYIELLNNADKPVWLSGFSYNGGAIEEITLEPGEYVLLSSPVNKESFSSFGNTVSASPFRALSNTSGQIVITDAFGNVVDSLYYSPAWYDHPQKRLGGWSLERVNPSLSCSDEDNWKASAAPQGGTPGRSNSVFNESPDNRPFLVSDVQTVSDKELRLSFSKPIPAENFVDAVFVLNGEKSAIQVVDLKTIILSFSSGLTSGQSYSLHMEDVNDCWGMALLENSYSFIYDDEGPKIIRIASLAPDELLVLFDEAVLSSTAEEASNYQINQVIDLVRSASLTDSVTVHLVLQQSLEMGRNHTFFANDLRDLSGNATARLEAEFLMDDQLDTVTWAGANLLDLRFHASLDSASVTQSSNFSVDKGIGSPVSSFLNSHNRQLVHLIFDQNLPVNTDLTLTAKNLANASGQPINSHKKSLRFDNRAISVAGFSVSNDSTIHLLFNKPLDRDVALFKNNYVINGGIGYPLVVEMVRPDSIILTVDKLLEGQEYTLSISGLQDMYGIKMSRATNRDFVFDLTGPAFLKAFLVSPFDIQLKANEAVTLPLRDQITINGQHAAEVKALSSSELMIRSPYEMTEDLVRLSLQDLSDLNGNVSQLLTVDIPNDQVKLGSAFIVKEDHIRLVFTQKIDPHLMQLPEQYLINDRKPVKVITEDNQFEVSLSLEAPLSLSDSALIEVHPHRNMDGKEGQKAVVRLYYDDHVKDLFVINPQLIQVVHATALDKKAAESGVYHLKDQSTQLRPIVNQSNPHLLQLALSHPLNPDNMYDLVLPPREDHLSKLIPGSIRSVIYDKSPPKLVMIEPLNEVEVLVSFDEALDPILSVVTSFYRVNDQEPMEIIPGEQDHQVILVLDAVLEKDLAYLLTVTQLEDLHRNAIVEESLEFYFDGPVAPAYKDLIINEIMAAPRAGQELPEAEYVELFNASKKTVALGGLIFANSRSSTVLPRATLLPGEFVLLTATSNQAAFQEFGLILGLSNWPSLVNGGDELRLLDRSGNLLDELHYTTDSYGSSEKAQEGYSLERVNPFAICPDPENLKPSENSLRGTPGQVNSVFDTTPDRTAPVLQKATSRREHEIVLVFSKRLNTDLNQVNISSSPAIAVESFHIDDTNPNWLVLTFNQQLNINLPYEISVENIRDCSGNQIDPSSNRAVLILPQQAEEGDIVLSEILFNPKMGYPKFIEIYNQSSSYINLQGWKLANVANDEAANIRIVAEEELILAPFSFMAFTTDASLLKQAYPSGKEEAFIELSSLPNYPQSRGAVLLLDPEDGVVQRFDYDEKFHHSLLDEVRGISLERLSLAAEVNEPKNWQSASATSGYATPGYRNSHAQENGLLERGITISPPVFVPDAPGEQNFTMISYQMDEPGVMATIRIYSIAGQMIKELCQNDIWGTSGFYTWDGTNLSGSKVRPGYYIVWVEVLNLEGHVKNIKKTVVVGSRF